MSGEQKKLPVTVEGKDVVKLVRGQLIKYIENRSRKSARMQASLRTSLKLKARSVLLEIDRLMDIDDAEERDEQLLEILRKTRSEKLKDQS